MFTCAGLRGRCGHIWAYSVLSWLWFEILYVLNAIPLREDGVLHGERESGFYLGKLVLVIMVISVRTLSMLSSRTFCNGNVLYLCCLV